MFPFFFIDADLLIDRYADLKNNRLTNYTFNFDQMLNDKVKALPFPDLADSRIHIIHEKCCLS